MKHSRLEKFQKMEEEITKMQTFVRKCYIVDSVKNDRPFDLNSFKDELSLRKSKDINLDLLI